ncbi:MAG: sigma-54 dependent transcriptional regulator [Spongiibacteraceae bacterium]
MNSIASIKRAARILVVEDDADLREALADTLELAEFDVLQVDSGEAALALLAGEYVDMVVSDVNMGGMDGLDLLKAIRQQQPQLPVLLITAHGSISKSVEAMRHGAVDYLVKPFKPQLLVEAVSAYAGGAPSPGEAEQPVAVEASSQQLLALARRVASTDSTVMICGESGTGKEVLARYIHRQSPRVNGPFVAINCAAIPENMLEAMLFGHEKGAFTGAQQALPGKFEQANGGTLLLDEISEMALPVQAKLLRVIQEREVERLGGRRTIALDVRILATTNRDLRGEVAAQRFREDLYYRLSVFPLQWLPLRSRPADISAIAERLLHKHATRMSRVGVRLDSSAERALRAHPWFGNVRELDNVMQRALILQMGPVIGADDLCLDPFASTPANATPAFADGAANGVEAASDLDGDLQRREFEIILDTLRDTRGSKKTAAEKLGISPRTLRYKLARMRDEGIDVEQLLEAS